MVYGPRRYGKTSLARAVEREAADEWGILGSPSFSVQHNGIRRLPGCVGAAIRSLPVHTSAA